MNKITQQLEELATTAPPSLAETVLIATGAGRFYDTVAGPTGELLIGWSSAGIFAAAPAGEEPRFLEEHTIASMEPLPAELPAALGRKVVAAIASGKLGKLPIDLSGLSEFQQAVLRKTAEIPPGQLRPYGWIAREIGKPGATRAVGSALNRNPVPVLIPCHRVGRSDGTVGQYAHGPEMKRGLLRAEGLDPDVVDEEAARGVRYVASATTNIFCHTTCHNARRIREANRIELRSIDGAHSKGFRACKVCRPEVVAA
ncbi:MAG: methylated-DNA--[protein]-cysteine S-methyltransferase [bacterium]|nr:methylated-DNA--[protein]-cysteine S-methyltransferase [bacterium]